MPGCFLCMEISLLRSRCEYESVLRKAWGYRKLSRRQRLKSHIIKSTPCQSKEVHHLTQFHWIVKRSSLIMIHHGKNEDPVRSKSLSQGLPEIEVNSISKPFWRKRILLILHKWVTGFRKGTILGVQQHRPLQLCLSAFHSNVHCPKLDGGTVVDCRFTVVEILSHKSLSIFIRPIFF